MAQKNKNGSLGHWKGYLQIAVVIGILVVALYFARAPEQIAIVEYGDLGDKQPPVVTVMLPETTSYNHRLNTTGSIILKERVSIISEVTGRVIWVSPYFEPGGTIEANEVFIEIDPTEYKLEVEAATQELAIHEITLEKQKALGEDVDYHEALRSKASSRLDLAKLKLAKTKLSLPYSFRVISSSVEVGVLAGTAEITGNVSVMGLVYRPESIRVGIPIEIHDIQALDPIVGRSAKVETVYDEFNAVVTGKSNIVAPKSKLATIFMKFDSELDPSEYPLPNTFVEVEIDGPVVSNVYLLPESSERKLGQIWIVRNGQLESFKPEILTRKNGMLVVKAFDSGDGIAIELPANTHEGQAVTILPVGI